MTTVPFYLRAPGTPPATLPVTQVSPPLLSFDGSTFMDDFLATVAAGSATALPELLAWRDWAEPPTGMLDMPGAPLYPGQHRAHARRCVSRRSRKRPARWTPTACRMRARLAAQAVPAAASALQLRRVRRGVHAAGWPMLDKARVKAAGAVVRRLVRDTSGERWEDWLSADGKTGLWFELHGGLPADPDAIPAGAYRDSANQPQDAAIAAGWDCPHRARRRH